MMNKNTILDRDNVELYIMSEEEENEMLETLMIQEYEDNEDEIMEDFVRELQGIDESIETNGLDLAEWQEEILEKEIPNQLTIQFPNENE